MNKASPISRNDICKRVRLESAVQMGWRLGTHHEESQVDGDENELLEHFLGLAVHGLQPTRGKTSPHSAWIAGHRASRAKAATSHLFIGFFGRRLSEQGHQAQIEQQKQQRAAHRTEVYWRMVFASRQ